MSSRIWIIVAGVTGALGVTIGAFGAHVLPSILERSELAHDEISRRMDTFETGVRYHMYHAVALLAVALLARSAAGPWPDIAGTTFLAGILIFSGLLYAFALTGVRVLGAIVPVGGVLLILGWIALLVAGVSSARGPEGQ